MGKVSHLSKKCNPVNILVICHEYINGKTRALRKSEVSSLTYIAIQCDCPTRDLQRKLDLGAR